MSISRIPQQMSFWRSAKLPLDSEGLASGVSASVGDDACVENFEIGPGVSREIRGAVLAVSDFWKMFQSVICLNNLCGWVRLPTAYQMKTQSDR